MSSKTQGLLKAFMFICIFAFMLYHLLTTEGKTWPLIGMVISAVLVVGYIKQALNK